MTTDDDIRDLRKDLEDAIREAEEQRARAERAEGERDGFDVLAAKAQRLYEETREQRDGYREMALMREREANEVRQRMESAERLLASTATEFDATDGAHPCWWRGHDRGVAGMRQRLEEVTRDLREERSRANDYLEAVAQIRADRDAWRLRAEGAEACLRDCNSGGDVGVADRRRFILAAYDALPASPVSLTTVPEGQREHLVPNPTSQIPAEQTDNQGDRHGTEEV